LGSQAAVAELVVPIPDGVQFAYENAQTGWDCAHHFPGGICTYQLGTVNAGASGVVTFDVYANVTPPPGDTITMSASIREVNQTSDLNPSNDGNSVVTPYVLGFAIIPSQEDVVVNEGETAVLTGTVDATDAFFDWSTFNFSSPEPTIGTTIGETPDTTWQWSYDTTDGLDESQPVTFYIEFNDGTVIISQTFQLTVTNVAPIIPLTGADSTLVNSSYSVQLGTVVDPGPDTVTACTINWGDGASEDCFAAIGGGTLNHTYTEALTTPNITVDLTDEDGTHLAAGSKTISVDAATLLVNVENGSVSIDEQADMVVVNNGRYSPTDGSVVLSASEGTVIDNGGGSWSWSLRCVARCRIEPYGDH
jgi:hypothetical protein